MVVILTRSRPARVRAGAAVDPSWIHLFGHAFVVDGCGYTATAKRVQMVWQTLEVADRIAELPAPGPLGARTVLVPNARVGHELRRTLVKRGHAQALVGTRFVSPAVRAIEVLRTVGVEFQPGEEALRVARLRTMFEDGYEPEGFGGGLVQQTRGWDDAFARTIEELEWAGLVPEALAGQRGVQRLWRTLLDEAGTSWTTARILREASERLESDPGLWREDGPVVAVLGLEPSAVMTRFAEAVPGCEIVTWTERPATSSGAQTDLEVVSAGLFGESDNARPRAGPVPDGTFALTEHAGVEDEIGAAAAWVARQVIQHQTALEDIAVLVPSLDPYAGLIRQRLGRLCVGANEGVAAYVAGGIPVTSTAAGARVATVLRAIANHLSADALAEALPVLRSADEDWRIPKGAAIDLAYSLGTIGGSPANPMGALEWRERIQKREATLEAKLRAAKADDDDERGQRDAERELRAVKAVRPAALALVDAAAGFVRKATLQSAWPQLREFLAAQLVAPGAGPRIPSLLDEVVGAAAADPMCGSIRGAEALRVVEQALRELRLSTGRFGEPAVYVGTVAGAAGLSFDAVRVLGLCEGNLPSHPRDDAVLPDGARERLRGVPTSSARTKATLRQLHQVIVDARREVVLSAPRLSVERTRREPSMVFLEIAAALGREGEGVPDLDALRHSEVRPAIESLRAFGVGHPVGQAAWLMRVATSERTIPAAWQQAAAVDPIACVGLASGDEWTAMDGVLGAETPAPVLPGLTSERALSASRLRDMLQCPLRFLYKHVFRWGEPTEARSLSELDALTFGGFVHTVVERFLREHGEAFTRREGALEMWIERARAIAAAEFAVLLEDVPLTGDLVKARELGRVVRDVEGFLEHEWSSGQPGRFVASEQAFGFDTPVTLRVGAEELHVHGYIDMIDVVGGRTRVRDLKTGKCTPRRGNDEGPLPVIDVQLAVYAKATRARAKDWGVPDDVGVAYVHTNDRFGRLRAFDDDYATLDEAADEWLETAALLMKARAFPRTPHEDDCSFCEFKPVCGPEAHERAEVLYETADGILERFRRLKG